MLHYSEFLSFASFNSLYIFKIWPKTTFLKILKRNNSNFVSTYPYLVVNLVIPTKYNHFKYPSAGDLVLKCFVSDCDQEQFLPHVQLQHAWKSIHYIPVWASVPREVEKGLGKRTDSQIHFKYLSPHSLSSQA